MNEYLKGIRLRASSRAWELLAGIGRLRLVPIDPAENWRRCDQAEFLVTGETRVGAIARHLVERTVPAASGRMIAVPARQALRGWPEYRDVAERVVGTP